jgi:metal-responsive CopG/Arc/MetJ family transcriptional regulator
MRIQVNLSDDMVEKLDIYASKMGVARSALCAMFIGQAVMGYDKAYEVIETAGTKAIIEQSKVDEA